MIEVISIGTGCAALSGITTDADVPVVGNDIASPLSFATLNIEMPFIMLSESLNCTVVPSFFAWKYIFAVKPLFVMPSVAASVITNSLYPLAVMLRAVFMLKFFLAKFGSLLSSAKPSATSTMAGSYSTASVYAPIISDDDTETVTSMMPSASAFDAESATVGASAVHVAASAAGISVTTITIAIIIANIFFMIFLLL